MDRRGRSQVPERSRSPRKQKCAECKKSFSSSATLRRHVEEQHLNKRERYACPYCPIKFSRKHDLDRHWQHAHKDQSSSADKTGEVLRTPGRDLDVLSIHPNSPIQQLPFSGPRTILQQLTVPPSPVRLPLQLLSLPSLPVGPHTATMAPTSPPIVRRVIVEPEERMADDRQPTHREVAVQTSLAQVVKERTIKELLDGSTVVSRVITEKFSYE